MKCAFEKIAVFFGGAIVESVVISVCVCRVALGCLLPPPPPHTPALKPQNRRVSKGTPPGAEKKIDQ